MKMPKRNAVWIFALCALTACGAQLTPAPDGDPGDASADGGCPDVCPDGGVCLDGACVAADPCEGISCPAGSHCEQGTCIVDDPCAGVECPNPGEVCQDGRCVSGEQDGDGDGYVARDDCDDTAPLIHPGAEEVCNGLDDNCVNDADGTDECAGYCCGATPGCRECCRDDQCGAGDWDCTVTFTCRCDGLRCGAACVAGGECCSATDCGDGAWSCTENRCNCDGLVCDGQCVADGECCSASDCGDGEWSCDSSGQCQCAGIECDGQCVSGECCSATDCGDGAWTCDSEHACACSGLLCGDECHPSGDCCTASECGEGSWVCASSSHTCSCPGVECAGKCYGAGQCIDSCRYTTAGWGACSSRFADVAPGRSINMAGMTTAEMCLTVCDPTGWTFHVADSTSCNGYGGDSGDFSNDAELHLNGTTLGLYPNDYGVDVGQSAWTTAGFVNASGCTERIIEISDQSVSTSTGWEVSSEYILRIDPPADDEGAIDSLWYVSLDTVMAGGTRTGTGANGLYICLQ